MVTGAIATGSMIGPGLQMAFTWSGYPGIKLMDNLLINMYTLPAVAACIINIVGLISLWLLFVERYSGLANEKTKVSFIQHQHPNILFRARLAIKNCQNQT